MGCTLLAMTLHCMRADSSTATVEWRILQYYEKGERDGEPVEIPKTVRLACYALTQGREDYSGPED